MCSCAYSGHWFSNLKSYFKNNEGKPLVLAFCKRELSENAYSALKPESEDILTIKP